MIIFRNMVKFSLMFAPLVLAGCATIVDGTTESLSVNSVPAGAKCTLTNTEGTWYVTAPGSVTVHKTKNDLKIHCDGDGGAVADMTVPAKFGGTTFANVLAGGVVGLGVDAMSGANYSYNNPITVVMTPKVASK